MTQTTILVVTGPLLITALAFLALLAASVSLRSGAHVLVWAGALGLSAVQWLLQAGGSVALAGAGGWPQAARALDFAGDLVGLVATILYVHGFRLRHGGRRDRAAFLAAAAVALLAFAAIGLGRDQRMAAMLLSAFKAPFFFWAAGRTVASRFRASPSELAAAAMLTAIGLVAMLLAACLCVDVPGQPLSWFGRFPMRILVAGPTSAATALFTILLIASDHSAERRRLVYTDPLTGLLNRLGFEALSDRFFRRRRAFSVAIADIDHFKAINDAHGHAVGDEVLSRLAASLTADLRADELAARIGGEEFVLLIGGSGQAALARVEALRASVTDLRLGAVPDLRITASFGVTEHARGEPLDRTIGRADGALYRSKRDGRDRTTLVEPLPA